MSGYLQYSNYGEDEKQIPSNQSTQSTQSTPSTQQHKRTLRANQRTLRSKQPSYEPSQIQQSQSQQSQSQQSQSQSQTKNPNQNKYAQELIQKMHNSGGSDSDSDDNEVYAQNSQNSQQNIQKQFQTGPVFNHTMYAPANGADLNARLNPAPAKEGFASKTLANATTPTPNQYPQYMPSVFQASGAAASENNDMLLQKLDHIITLLEDQHDEKTGHVTEELVLYCFLGVFIIFIVDSFARAGKYVR
jgi:hypothetical protein